MVPERLVRSGCLIESFISFAPGGAAEFVGNILQSVCVLFACLFAGMGVLLHRLSAQHWLNRSTRLKWSMFGFTAVCTLVVLSVTIG